MLRFGSKFVYNNASDSEDEGDEVIDEADLAEDLASYSLAPAEATMATNALDDDDAVLMPAAPAQAAPRGGGLMSSIRNVFGGAAPSAYNESAAAAAPAPVSFSARTMQKKRAPTAGRGFRRHVDTNVLSLTLESLADGSELATGDANPCSNCDAVLSAVSQLEEVADDDEASHRWTCEFCGTVNALLLDAQEIPREGVDTVDYILAPPPVAGAPGLVRQASIDEAPVVFVLDTSGSMCQTQEAPQSLRLRGDRRGQLANLRQAGDGDQYLPGEARDVTWISRLQCVQAAVTGQLEQMSATRSVALVTFNNQVCVVGDGSAAEQTVEGDRLGDLEALLALGRQHTPSRTLSETKAALTDKVWGLEEGGQTALGPAMAVALGMVEGTRGAKIVLCTDGMANVGLGSLDPDGLDDAAADQLEEEASSFYAQLGELALSRGVIVDVIGVEGANCSLENLGAMAEHTSGTTTRVNPINLTRDFAGILANPVIATGVEATLILHAGLSFRSGDEANAATGASKLSKAIGNATAESEVSFEYLVKTRAEREALGFGSLSDLPFQVQIVFTDLQGAKKMRVVTQHKPVTKRRGQAQAEVDMGVLGAHAAQTVAKMAQNGQYGSSRATARAWTNVMARACQDNGSAEQLESYRTFVGDLADLDTTLASAQQQDRDAGFSDSDEEAEATEERSRSSSFSLSGATKKASRAIRRKKARGRNDELSSQLYTFKRKGQSAYQSQQQQQQQPVPVAASAPPSHAPVQGRRRSRSRSR